MVLHRLINWKPKSNSLKNPSVLRFFSTSDSKGEPQTPAAVDLDVSSSPEPEPATTTRSQPSSPSYLSQLQANLKNKKQQSQPNSQSFQFKRSTSPSFTSTNTLHSKSPLNLEEIKKALSKYRPPSAVSPTDSDVKSSSTSESPPLKHQPHEISLQDLYNRNLSENSDMSKGNGQMSSGKVGEALSFDSIRVSLRKSAIGAQNAGRKVNVDRMSFLSVQNKFNLKPSDAVLDSKVVGGRDTLPISVFGREMIEKKEVEKSATKTELQSIYTFGQLGQRLKELRPEVKEGNWFSLQELSERLSKLREIEVKEAESANISTKILKNTLEAMQSIKLEGPKRSPLQRFDIYGLGQIGRTSDFMLKPPKEHLVEMYFHPDNMSSAEKLKIELTKVREEFKMSESDCGSARVQVAQLTTRIKHLSSVLHKKDKHSRKGLEEMVQRRKKLLKYLRRTDWDSYCFVISKLGLRDNPLSRA